MSAPSAVVCARPEPDVGAKPTDWILLAEKLQCGDPSGMEELREIFSGGIRFLLRRYLGTANLDQEVEVTLQLTASAVRAGELEQPEQLVRLVRTTVQRRVRAARSSHKRPITGFRSLRRRLLSRPGQ